MLDVIKYSYAGILDTLWLLPNWLVASALVICGILVALIANAVIVHVIRNTLGVRHPKTRSLLTRSKGPLRLALIVLAAVARGENRADRRSHPSYSAIS